MNRPAAPALAQAASALVSQPGGDMSRFVDGRMPCRHCSHHGVLPHRQLLGFLDHVSDHFGFTAAGRAGLLGELERIAGRTMFAGLTETALHQQQVDATLIEDCQDVVEAAHVGPA